jgi:ATP-dependent RNA helicase RhlB
VKKAEADPTVPAFSALGLSKAVLEAVSDAGYESPSPIQAATIPVLLAGHDMLGQAQTGTGKTAAFLLTIMQHAFKHPLAERRPGTPRALVLAPTRELVMQIQKDAVLLGSHAGFKSVAVFGGMDYEKQKRQLHGQTVDLIAATPGRLIDFLRGRVVDLSRVEILVLDEADRMLDMGFIPDVRRIIHQTPHKDRRQTLLFSATAPVPKFRFVVPVKTKLPVQDWALFRLLVIAPPLVAFLNEGLTAR